MLVGWILKHLLPEVKSSLIVLPSKWIERGWLVFFLATFWKKPISSAFHLRGRCVSNPSDAHDASSWPFHHDFCCLECHFFTKSTSQERHNISKSDLEKAFSIFKNLVVSNIFYFPFHIWECHHPNWRTNSFIFFRVAQPPTRWYSHWIGLREILQETMVFTIKYRAFRFSVNFPIIQFYDIVQNPNKTLID